MGRTNPTYRRWLEGFEGEYRPFRRALRRRHQADFDRLFEKARTHADAAGYVNRADPVEAAMVAILLAQERETRRLEERVEALEDRLDE